MNKKKLIIIIILLFIAVFWIIGIYKLSGMNAENSDHASKSIITIFIEDTIYNTNKYGLTDININSPKIDQLSELINVPLRKVMHAFVYFVLSIIILCILTYLLNNKKYLLSIFITLVLIIIFASFDEFHQTFVDGRNGSIKDVIIDTIGGITGIMIYSSYFLAYIKGFLTGYKHKNML